MESPVVRVGLLLAMGDVARYVRCNAGTPFQAVSSGRSRGAGGCRLTRWRYSAAAHVGYCTAISAVRACGVLRGGGAQLSMAAISPRI